MVKGDGGTWSTVMSEAIQFRQYADEALRWAAKAATEKSGWNPIPEGATHCRSRMRATLCRRVLIRQPPRAWE
jgi:hypothetical protein